jgi:hypothetical protein
MPARSASYQQGAGIAGVGAVFASRAELASQADPKTLLEGASEAQAWCR